MITLNNIRKQLIQTVDYICFNCTCEKEQEEAIQHLRLLRQTELAQQAIKDIDKHYKLKDA